MHGSHGRILKLSTDFQNLRDPTHREKKLGQYLIWSYSVQCSRTTHKHISLTNIPKSDMNFPSDLGMVPVGKSHKISCDQKTLVIVCGLFKQRIDDIKRKSVGQIRGDHVSLDSDNFLILASPRHVTYWLATCYRHDNLPLWPSHAGISRKNNSTCWIYDRSGFQALLNRQSQS